ncbi:hypothetical protein IMG5_186210 [Ichthyophthirius multifiliis]|uniref:Transmembrane protein n=1 Tax=Ichthyophthirius multifiliis TaxID=5932 RepID=G0R3L3_ICHMU|nr:hypothetical protein IMG5_186210 [Ichthyophthirius multifiliis]EGR27935.1 hypothetical protein IMG5_186210 [Ichthyophthirius multifiliis]|eukprot:XP_004027280.1 hypothetical protein IMG5_186210 [Ichthyophthirius multifiliis]
MFFMLWNYTIRMSYYVWTSIINWFYIIIFQTPFLFSFIIKTIVFRFKYACIYSKIIHSSLKQIRRVFFQCSFVNLCIILFTIINFFVQNIIKKFNIFLFLYLLPLSIRTTIKIGLQPILSSFQIILLNQLIFSIANFFQMFCQT